MEIMNNNANKYFKLFEITTNVEGQVTKEIVDVNIEATVIDAIKLFTAHFPNKANYITDAQLVSGEGQDDLTIFMIGEEPVNLKKAFKVAFNLLSREQRYVFSRTPGVVDLLKHQNEGAQA